MVPFPVSSSILAASPLVSFLQERYALGAAAQCRLIRSGINDTYLVTDRDNKYIFRIYSLHWRTELEISEEIRLLNRLQAQGISISYPLADRKENYIQVLDAPEGKRFAVLFSHAAGEKRHTYAQEIHYQVGELMARLHQVVQHQTLQRVSYTPQILIVEALAEIENFLAADTPEMKFLQSTGAYLLQAFSEVQVQELRPGIVHLDIWFDNMNIDQNGKATIFDFDFCGNGWLCLDLAYYVLQLYSLEKDETECREKTASFISGYESVTRLSVEEKRILPMLGISLYFFYLGVQCRRFENWSNSFLSEAYLKRFINVLVKKYFETKVLGQTPA